METGLVEISRGQYHWVRRDGAWVRRERLVVSRRVFRSEYTFHFCHFDFACKPECSRRTKPAIRARGCSSQGRGWEQGPAPMCDFISQACPPDRDGSIDIIILKVGARHHGFRFAFLSFNRTNRASPGPDELAPATMVVAAHADLQKCTAAATQLCAPSVWSY